MIRRGLFSTETAPATLAVLRARERAEVAQLYENFEAQEAGQRELQPT